jgi:TetR/AcrR family transcriptional repressor of nem operon
VTGKGSKPSGPTGIEGIRAYFEHVVEGILQGNRRWGCLGTNAFVELNESDDEIAKIMKNHLVRLAKAFEHALVRDGIANPDHWAQHLLCVSQGLNVIAKTEPDIAALRPIIDTTISALKMSNRQALTV